MSANKEVGDSSRSTQPDSAYYQSPSVTNDIQEDAAQESQKAATERVNYASEGYHSMSQYTSPGDTASMGGRYYGQEQHTAGMSTNSMPSAYITTQSQYGYNTGVERRYPGQPTTGPLVATPDDAEVEVHPEEYPDKFTRDNYDGVIIYAQDDHVAVTRLMDEMKTKMKLKNGKPPLLFPYEEMYGRSELATLDDAMERSTFILFYLSPGFCSDTWSNLRKDECLTETLEHEDKRWCIIPLYSQPKKSAQFKVPIGIRALRGIDVSGDDKVYLDSIKKLFDGKLAIRERRQKNQKFQLEMWIKRTKTTKRMDRRDRLHKEQLARMKAEHEERLAKNQRDFEVEMEIKKIQRERNRGQHQHMMQMDKDRLKEIHEEAIRRVEEEMMIQAMIKQKRLADEEARNRPNPYLGTVHIPVAAPYTVPPGGHPGAQFPAPVTFAPAPNQGQGQQSHTTVPNNPDGGSVHIHYYGNVEHKITNIDKADVVQIGDKNKVIQGKISQKDDLDEDNDEEGKSTKFTRTKKKPQTDTSVLPHLNLAEDTAAPQPDSSSQMSVPQVDGKRRSEHTVSEVNNQMEQLAIQDPTVVEHQIDFQKESPSLKTNPVSHLEPHGKHETRPAMGQVVAMQHNALAHQHMTGTDRGTFQPNKPVATVPPVLSAGRNENNASMPSKPEEDICTPGQTLSYPGADHFSPLSVTGGANSYTSENTMEPVDSNQVSLEEEALMAEQKLGDDENGDDSVEHEKLQARYRFGTKPSTLPHDITVGLLSGDPKVGKEDSDMYMMADEEILPTAINMQNADSNHTNSGQDSGIASGSSHAGQVNSSTQKRKHSDTETRSLDNQKEHTKHDLQRSDSLPTDDLVEDKPSQTRSNRKKDCVIS